VLANGESGLLCSVAGCTMAADVSAVLAKGEPGMLCGVAAWTVTAELLKNGEADFCLAGAAARASGYVHCC
jgi:hypothetical protein